MGRLSTTECTYLPTSPDVDPGLRLWQCLMQRNRRWKSCSLTRRGMS